MQIFESRKHNVTLDDNIICVTNVNGRFCCKSTEEETVDLASVKHCSISEGRDYDVISLFFSTDSVGSFSFKSSKEGSAIIKEKLKSILPEFDVILEKKSGFISPTYTKAFLYKNNWIIGEIKRVGIWSKIKNLVFGTPMGETSITGLDLATCSAYQSFTRLLGGCNLFLVAKNNLMEIVNIAQEEANKIVDLISELCGKKLNSVKVYQSADTPSRLFNPFKKTEYIFYTKDGIAVREKTWRGKSIIHFFNFEDVSLYLIKGWFTSKVILMRNVITNDSDDRSKRDYFISETSFWKSNMTEFYDDTMSQINMENAIVYKPVWWHFFAKEKVICLPNVVLCMSSNNISAFSRPVSAEAEAADYLTVNVRINGFEIPNVFRYKWKKFLCCCCGEMQDEVLRDPRDIIDQKETKKVHL